jgi:hypothetical protein
LLFGTWDNYLINSTLDVKPYFGGIDDKNLRLDLISLINISDSSKKSSYAELVKLSKLKKIIMLEKENYATQLETGTFESYLLNNWVDEKLMARDELKRKRKRGRKISLTVERTFFKNL